MKTDAFRRRLNGRSEEHGKGSPAWNQALRQTNWGNLTPMIFAQKLAETTTGVLVDLAMLDPVEGRSKLQDYGASVDALSLQGKTFLHAAFEDQGELTAAVRSLQRLVNAHVWGMTHRIVPPEAFYRSHSEVKEVCRLTGTVIVDASTLSTLTTASLNPLAGEIMAFWFDQYFTQSRREPRRRFYSHVALVPKQWPGIFRSHFGGG